MATAKTIIIFASKYIGLETTRHVIENSGNVQLIVTADNDDPDTVKIRNLAKKRRIPHRRYSGLLQQELSASGVSYDWLLNLWSPYIIRREVLELFAHRLNIHSGLVPGTRGNDTVAWSIRNKLKAGAALLEMEPGIDSGGVYIQSEVRAPFPIRGYALQRKIIRRAIALFRQHWAGIYQGKMPAVKQTGRTATFTRKETESDRVRVAGSVMRLDDFVRWGLAHDFSPGTQATMDSDGELYTIRLTVRKIKKSP